MKNKIQNAIIQFNQLSLFDASINLLKVLGYESPKIQQAHLADYIELFKAHETANIEKAKVATDWKSANFIFQLTTDEIIKQHDLFTDVKKVNNVLIESYFIVAIELTKDNYTRTDLAEISRQVNKLHGLPTLILFKYNNFLTISITYRRDNKKDSDKEVLGKVTLIKDIDIAEPKRSHIEILFDLSINELKSNFTISNWVQLHDTWQKTLDTKTLNNRFYKEIANWYFWAIENVEFPRDAEKDKLTGKDTISVIRMLTRLVFCWFMKEKEKLIPEKLFIKSEVEKLLNDLSDNESTYYKAILQNLFFATLNTKQSDRNYIKGYNNHGEHNLFRYSDLFKEKVELKNIFKNIPYLNGGIFDCLDIKNKDIKREKERKYIDGFSERGLAYQPKVPNVLFFGEKKHDTDYGMDLCKIYETPKKKYELEGIVNILNSYKFTITENTPLEQEIALDPELLGKVFESLLAYYNPETGQNARKQQGSYYTPVEIVEYMVDESLKQYLKNTIESRPKSFVELGKKQTNMFGNDGAQQASFQLQTDKCFTDSKEIDKNIETLITFNTSKNPFNKEETSFLINAILKIKICDPACGSGAFPIGILNKLVYILKKLDEDGVALERVLIELKTTQTNELLENKEKLKELLQDKEQAEKISLERARKLALDELENEIKKIRAEFKLNQPNFLRKLYLIKNCIYGVDIQSIAVTISKLRFFLSLLVDTTVHHDKANKGIEPLPNLDYKLMQGNSLLESFEDINLSVEAVNKEMFDDNKISSFSDKDISKLLEKINVYFYTSDHTEKEEINKTISKIITDFLHKIIDVKINNINNKIKETENNLKANKKSQKTANTKALETKYASIIKQLEQDLKFYENELAHKKEQKLKIDEVLHQNENRFWFLWHLFFKDVFDNGGFDIVIGNPPYVQLQKNDGVLADLYEKTGYETFERTGDIYSLFYEKGVQILKENGVLTFITSSQWTKANYGKSLRFILSNKNPILLLLLGAGVFENAIVDTNILIVQNNYNKHILNGLKVNNLEEISHISKEKLIPMPNVNSDTWVITPPLKQTINSRLLKKGKPLNEWNIKINFGIKTGYNEAFLLKSEQALKLLNKSANNKKIIKPVLRGRNVEEYFTRWEGDYIINSHNGLKKEKINRIDIEKYPDIKSHLDEYKKEVFHRTDQGDTPYNLRNCAYLNEFQKEKIIWKRIGSQLRFSYSNEEIYCLDSTCIATGEKIKYLVALLNSKLCKYQLFENSPRTGMGDLIISVQALEPLLVYYPTEIEEQPFITLVDKILAKKKSGENTDIEEAEIDSMVYQLYGLTDEEKKIVEGESLSGSKPLSD